MKVVINTCFGGFSVSDKAVLRLRELTGRKVDTLAGELYDVERHDPALVQVVEELGEEANGCCAKLRIVEIPDGVDYSIEEYDGKEHIAESHRTWW